MTVNFLQVILMRRSPSDIPTESIPDKKVIRETTTENECPSVFPKKVPYLIIGGGAASWSAFRAIKDHVPNAKVP